MLQEQSRLFQRILFFTDAALVALAWTAAYFTRFDLLRVSGLYPPPEWLPPSAYLSLIPWVLILSMTVFWASGLYVPDRAQRLSSLVWSVARAIGLGVLAVAAALSFYRELSFSRLHLILFGAYMPVMLVGIRAVLYSWLRRRRRQGSFKRRVLIVGAGDVGQRLKRSFEEYPWMGFDLIGYVDDHKQDRPDVLGGIDGIGPLLDRHESEGRPVDYIYVALPITAMERIEKVLNEASTRLAHVCLVPDVFQFDILNSRISDIGGLPVIHLIDETPLDFRRGVKRILDVIFSLFVLILLSPLLVAIAVAVKVSSPGPVFYRQERMGLNGHTFEILKFRSMPVNAERETGAVWAKPGEQRATRIGSFLRRTSLDELPQFFNVLRGDMSVVGPRPERPVFIEQFRDQVPRYMLRHKMKAGITGWAQVHGWRGDTSIEKRIEFDLYYIQHWSLKLDLKIMLMTVFRGFVHRNAY
ncbi:MAG: undecaprenyl-phosphate glucose phosphotransferase [Rhodothermales bacterium]|nr:undecaprenyl-phosphate glucose phosphotransferase [Rhodothermales bacterium]